MAILTGLFLVLVTWTLVSVLATVSRQLAESPSMVCRAGSLVTAMAGLGLCVELVRFILG